MSDNVNKYEIYELNNDDLWTDADIIECVNCGELYRESELPYINGMYDYTCPTCGYVN